MTTPDSGRTNIFYRAWRDAIRKRDKGKCQWPNCNRKGREVHHIVPYYMAPHLRYEVENGILFCARCHKKLKNKETLYIDFCMQLISSKKEKK